MRIIIAIILLAFAAGIQLTVWSFFLLWRKEQKKGIIVLLCGSLLIMIPVVVTLVRLYSRE